MQATIKILLIVFTFFLTSNLFAQSPKNNETFIQEIDIIIQLLKDKPVIYKLTKGKLSLKTKIVGDFDNNSKRFKRKIKLKKGLIVEKIRIKEKGEKGYKKYLDIVLINNEYYFIKRTNYSSDLSVIDSTEIFIGRKIYKRFNKGSYWH